MRYALVNPDWDFEGSVYFGCREPHLPLEFGYAGAVLEREGHAVLILDAHLESISPFELVEKAEYFSPHFIIIATAPTYLFWRCPQPELRVPMQTARLLSPIGATLIAVGPHASVTPAAVLKKMEADIAVVGEFESVLHLLDGRAEWERVPGLAFAGKSGVRLNPGTAVADLSALPAITWPQRLLDRHIHHHHRFDAGAGAGLGAEIESSRGCPFGCTFCARNNFRGEYRRRPVEKVLAELDCLIERGVRYIYFIDEIFLPDRKFLRELERRNIRFGVQTRIDFWSEAGLDRLGGAGCVSIEAGVESITSRGRSRLQKTSRLDGGRLIERLAYARKKIPFVQATLMETGDDPSEIAQWSSTLRDRGVWINDPVPLFPYPGSREYSLRWGEPDEEAWEKALGYYLETNPILSDLQTRKPLPLSILERR
ncbi:MAG: TIGR04295 family B12-binding domain-containing radical SAM protein [Syntrophales bacterium]|nr:TIGR04295 family B12-binding domain-containing radical SAM protein [Syntrophales bacterium]HPL64238.1 TIGR04295 family B12-binding domain-containing radical SAM protein [Syntrophales bacterium]